MADLTDTLERLLDDPEIQAAAQQAEAQEQSVPTNASPLGALPPELISKLPALMGALGPMLGNGDGKRDEKTALLLALKPYMSPQRCAAIDKLITLSRLGEVMKQIR